ncbi:hypothetical protein [Sphingomonas sp. 10B4]|uniref:hypothetical protein n=1 Tax=Sphingomonas sp. 10B4 TaxID=3048575 RepID=UPI002AB41217|nr:hypothetical protein [Sphingomonas sp. 10B4]MDY7523865.1 hypothetical protein [Sphingomonas sp. 10B4]MEB0283112.1 hypothetical protein [Sphingomonas sp. 10B4]
MRSSELCSTIVGTATRAAKTARAEEKAASHLINVQSAEDIVKYPTTQREFYDQSYEAGVRSKF